ncbi:MAG: tetratricopeptide repeat protein, partial [Gammaproteobacteria bacterium]|nr:tetratricopeptide repeat protein [Gammaproteobacteria bacterium]
TLRAALTLRPGYVRGHIKVAELLLDMGRLDECREELDRLITRFPDRAEAYFLSGQLENRTGQPAKAITAFKIVYEISGDFGALHYGLAQSYRQLGDQTSAAHHAALYEQHKNSTANSADPVFAEMGRLNISETALIKRAKEFARRGDNDNAEALLNRALETNPDSFAAHITLVGLYATRKQFDKADAQLDIARQLDPRHPSLFYNTGIARLAEERWTEAERAFRRCLEIDPKKADAHTQIGLINELRRRSTQAEMDYRKALAIDPWHRQANWLLGRLLLAAGDAPEAIKRLERVRSARDPSAPGILMDLARAYEEDDQIKRAATAATEARDAAQKFQDQRIVNLASGMLLRLDLATTSEARQ